jgi:hypothetical protein
MLTFCAKKKLQKSAHILQRFANVFQGRVLNGTSVTTTSGVCTAAMLVILMKYASNISDI